MDNGGKNGEGHPRTCIKDRQTKPNRGGIEDGGGRSRESSGGKRETTVFEQQFKKEKVF